MYNVYTFICYIRLISMHVSPYFETIVQPSNNATFYVKRMALTIVSYMNVLKKHTYPQREIK